jgi:outer membrane protein assembly factor BamB
MKREDSPLGTALAFLITRPSVVAICCFASTSFSQPLWPQFRGPTGQGISTSAHPPVSFATSNALWTAEVPPGHSSPCIWGDKLFLSTFQSNKLDCRAYSRTDGKLLWFKEVPTEKIERTHPFSNPAAATPAADSSRVYFYFGSYGILAFGHDGKAAWDKKLPAPVSRGHYGSASSPTLFGELLIEALDTDEGGSRVLALRRGTGETAWETPRPDTASGWSTPVVWTNSGKPQLILLGSQKLTAYDPANGKELWSVPGFPYETAPSPAYDEKRVFACSAGIGGRSNPKFEGSGWTDLLKFDTNKDGKIQFEEVPASFRLVQRPELPEGHPGRLLPFDIRSMMQGMDTDKDGAISKEEWEAGMGMFEQWDRPILMALQPEVTSGDTNKIVAWQVTRGIPEVPSPICYQGKVFLVRDGGLVQCITAASGSVLYQERLGAAGGYAASPVAAQGHVYFCSQAGTITVIDAAGDQLKVIAQNTLGEKIAATPALVEDKIYVRTEKHLFAFGGR